MYIPTLKNTAGDYVLWYVVVVVTTTGGSAYNNTSNRCNYLNILINDFLPDQYHTNTTMKFIYRRLLEYRYCTITIAYTNNLGLKVIS